MQANKLSVGDKIILPEGLREVISLYREFDGFQSIVTNDGLTRKFPSEYEINVTWSKSYLRSVA